LLIDEDVRGRFPDLHVLLVEIDGVEVVERLEELERFKEEVYARIRSRFNLETLKDEPIIRCYRKNTPEGSPLQRGDEWRR